MSLKKVFTSNFGLIDKLSSRIIFLPIYAMIVLLRIVMCVPLNQSGG